LANSRLWFVEERPVIAGRMDDANDTDSAWNCFEENQIVSKRGAAKTLAEMALIGAASGRLCETFQFRVKAVVPVKGRLFTAAACDP
jgi:hypothetical protein